MPYCPKCDMEFIDGVTVCTDCGGPLVESKEAALAMKAAEREKELAREELAREELRQDDPEELRDTETPRTERTGVYVDKSQKYSDLKSSASAFLAVGCVLAVVSVLLWTGIIRLPMAAVSGMIFRGALTLMAVFSLGVYLNTSRDAKKLAPQIDQEKERTEKLLQWFTGQYSAESIDREIPDADSLTEEERSLRRFQLIQDHLVTGQDLPDPSYVDALSEEIYSRLFEGDASGRQNG